MAEVVKATPVESVVAADAPPGGFKFYTTVGGAEPVGMHVVCPCGCGAVLGVSFAPGRWTWNGDRERPTVRPSILHMEGCRWHGFLTEGEFRSC